MSKELAIDKQARYWLTAIGLGLIALHLSLNEHFGRSGSFNHNSLFWMVLAFLLWDKREQLKLESNALGTFMGISILSFVFYRYLHLFPDDFFLRISPFLSLLGWGLLASGIQGLRQYYREFFLLFFLAIPWEFVYIFDLSQLTARFSSFILWILGFEVTRQGIWIIMPTGSVEVYSGCSGLRTILQLLGLIWILLTLVVTNWRIKIALPVAAILLGFVINGIRVALMAILVATSNTTGFDYWHTGTGSLIFSAIAVVLLGVVSFLTIPQENWQI